MAFAGGHGGPGVVVRGPLSLACVRVMGMMKRGARGLSSVELTPSWALDLVPRGLALSAQPSNGVELAAQVALKGRRSHFDIAAHSLIASLPRPHAIASQQGATRVRQHAHKEIAVRAMRFGGA